MPFVHQKNFTDGSFSSQYLSNERYNYELLLMIILFVVEWNNRFKEEPLSGKQLVESSFSNCGYSSLRNLL
jgi:hypothetical protein